MSVLITCSKRGCVSPAIGAVALALYPHKGTMRFYKRDDPLVRLTFAIVLCATHFDQVKPEHLFTFAQISAFARAIEDFTGTTVDLNASRLLRVDLGDPQYLRAVRTNAQHGVPSTL